MLRSISHGNVGRNDTGYSDHRDLEAVLDCIDAEKLVEALSPPAGQRGPKGYDREGVVRALIAMRLLGIPTVSELHRELDNNPALRRVCGMDRPGALPSADTIRRVRRRLVELAGTLREAIGETPAAADLWIVTPSKTYSRGVRPRPQCRARGRDTLERRAGGWRFPGA